MISQPPTHPTTTSEKVISCSLECKNGKCVKEISGEEGCLCDAGFKPVETTIFFSRSISCQPDVIKPPTTTILPLTTTSTMTSTTTSKKPDLQEPCSLECDHGKCVPASGWFSTVTEKCECDSGYRKIYKIIFFKKGALGSLYLIDGPFLSLMTNGYDIHVFH